MYLDSHLTTYNLKAFAKLFGIGDNHVHVVVFIIVDLAVSNEGIAVSLVSVVITIQGVIQFYWI